MASVIGLVSAKVNGLFRVDVKNLHWQNRRSVNQTVTQGGTKISKGVYLVSGSFEEVIPKTGAFDWNSLENFSVQFYDYETGSILIFAAEGCEIEGADGSTDLGAANTAKTISWKGTLCSKF